jgi:hypothetical protein
VITSIERGGCGGDHIHIIVTWRESTDLPVGDNVIIRRLSYEYVCLFDINCSGYV